ncbi:MAG: hypothetical protein QME14_03830 [Methanobacteriaceae archaeon]|nr:hypothetical protein [Methanobacteriaceae archaeon]
MNELYKKILDLNYLPRFLSITIILGINWTFQSLLYMDKTEKLFKLLIDLIGFLIIFMVLNQLVLLYIAFILSIIIVHTLNWIFNGHIFALLKTFGIIKTDYGTFIEYIDYLKEKSSKENSISLVVAYGSLSREKIKETSDLDIRIIRKKGFICGVRACIFTMFERTNSFINRFPLDIYVGDSFEFLKKADEKPIIIFKNV